MKAVNENEAVESVGHEANEQGAKKLKLTVTRAKKLRTSVKAGPPTSGQWTLNAEQQF